jgi:photosystem II stability/assembly factor-like uncharacterized protein
MTKKTVIFFLFLSTCSLFAQNGWYSTTSPISDLWIQKIQFTSVNTGYAIGPVHSSTKSYFLKTTNTGNNWQSIFLDSLYINSLFFINDNTGYIFGSKDNAGGIIQKTIDGGNTWTSQASGITNFFYTGYFFNVNTGYAGGKYGYNAKTINGGINWITKPSSNITWFDDIYFVNQNTGFGVDSKLFKTTDGGDSWFVNYDDNLFYCCINFLNSATGFITGQSGRIIKTTDSGDNWSVISNQQTNISSIFFVNQNTGYFVNNYLNVYKSTNGGVNWFAQLTGATSTSLISVFFLNENTGFAGGANGVILKTIKGGVGVQNISSSVPDKYSLEQNYPNPFNPTTNIRYQITKNSYVTLKVYNILGKEIATLVNEKLSAGTYEVKFDGSNLPSGIYFYKLETDKFKDTKKLVLLK